MKLLGIFAIAVLLLGFTSYTGHSFAQTDNAKSATSTGSETVPNQTVNPATEKQSEDVEAQKEKAMEKYQAIKDKRKTAFEERKKDLQKVKESGTKEKTSELREKAIAERKLTMEKINAIREKAKAESKIDIEKIKETMEKASSIELHSAIEKWGGYSAEPISDSELLDDFGIEASHIPFWFKNSAKWVVNSDISIAEFEDALKYLYKKGIVN